MKKYVVIGNAESVHLVKWVKQLVRYYDVYVISSKNTHEKIKQMVPDKNIYNLQIDLKAEGGNCKILQKYFTVKRILKRTKPDFVNPHYITSFGLIVAMVKRFSRLNFVLIQSAWGTDILVTPFKNKLYFRITKFCLDAADLVTSDSDHMTRVIKSMSGTKTLTFTFGLENLPEINLNLKDEYLFYSNRMLTDNYNIHEVIEFFHRIFIENPSARLIISHDGKNRKKLEARSIELGLKNNIQFKGFISEEEQISYYAKTQFYISFPISDATSVSLLEAMAYGCIPVVSDIPANREWITKNTNGIFYQKNVTGLKEIEEALYKKEKIAEINRNIIKYRAIFPDNIRNYVNELKDLKF